MSLAFGVEAPGPFAVGTGQPRTGLDDTVRKANPLPASEIKGAMRAAACVLLRVDRGAPGPGGLLSAIFGAEGSGGAWAWSEAGPAEAFMVTQRSRIRLDEHSGTVQRESLAATQSAWIRPGKQPVFTVEQMAPLNDPQLHDHVAVLLSSAYAVTAVGSWRNRGMGAVSFRPLDWQHFEPLKLNRQSVVKVVARLRMEGGST